MKKIFFVFALLFAVPFFFGSVSAETTVCINGKIAEIPPEMGSIRTESSRTFVPVRFLLEHFGYDVSWDGEDMVVFGTDGKNIFVMQTGSTILTFSSEKNELQTIYMDVSPFLDANEERTYIPLRFFAEAIGYNVGYNEASGTVILDKK